MNKEMPSQEHSGVTVRTAAVPTGGRWGGVPAWSKGVGESRGKSIRGESMKPRDCCDHRERSAQSSLVSQLLHL